MDGSRHRTTHEFEEALPILRIRNALLGERLRGADAEECRLQLRMSAHRFTQIELLLAQLPCKPSTLGKEFQLLDDPSRAMGVMFFLSDDTSLGVPLLRSDRYRAARYPARTDEVADLWPGLPGRERPLEIFPPEGPLALAGQELQVVGEVFLGAELVMGPAVLG